VLVQELFAKKKKEKQTKKEGKNCKPSSLVRKKSNCYIVQTNELPLVNCTIN